MRGLNYPATTKLVRSSDLKPYQQGILRNLVTGAVRSKRRLLAQGLVESDICELCNEQSESHWHMLCTCSNTAHIRAKHATVSDPPPNTWLEVQWRHALWPAIPGLIEWQASRGNRQLAAPSAVRDHHHTLTNAEGLHIIDGYVWVWTDGAAEHPGYPDITCSSSGVFWRDEHDSNLAFSSLGSEQSNQRCEAEAVHAALLQAASLPYPLFIRSDSEYCVHCLSDLQLGLGLTKDHSHDDIWQAIKVCLQSRQHPVRISWVKGHAKQHHIDAGQSSDIDQAGNDAADVLAGGAVVLPPAAVLDAFISAQSEAQAYQMRCV